MNGVWIEGLCAQCDAPLRTALVRELRHYEDARLLEIVCASCEMTFLAVATDRPPVLEAIEVHDVARAAQLLGRAQRLTDLFDLDAA